jgi:hypothetical protein
MGTKNNPGAFDCHADADPDEPIFTLRGNDPSAAFVVAFWAELRKLRGKPEDEKYQEACACATAMEKWAKGHGKSEEIDAIVKLVDGVVFR